MKASMDTPGEAQRMIEAAIAAIDELAEANGYTFMAVMPSLVASFILTCVKNGVDADYFRKMVEDLISQASTRARGSAPERRTLPPTQ